MKSWISSSNAVAETERDFLIFYKYEEIAQIDVAIIEFGEQRENVIVDVRKLTEICETVWSVSYLNSILVLLRSYNQIRMEIPNPRKNKK